MSSSTRSSSGSGWSSRRASRGRLRSARSWSTRYWRSLPWTRRCSPCDYSRCRRCVVWRACTGAACVASSWRREVKLMTRLSRWLGSLLASAEDPRPPLAEVAAPSEAEALLEALQRSRAELLELRSGLEPESAVARDLAHEAQALLEIEANLALSLDERRARAALLRARRRATEAELLADL